jgi:large repetitive protein
MENFLFMKKSNRVLLIYVLLMAISLLIHKTVESQNYDRNQQILTEYIYGQFGREKEIAERRDRTSKHFMNPDGVITAVITSGSSLHYYDQGVWKDISCEIVSTNEKGFGFVNRENVFASFFPLASGDIILTRLKEGDLRESSQVIFHYLVDGRLTGTVFPAQVNGRSEGNSILYPGIIQGVDLSYGVLPDGRKMDIILNNNQFLSTAPNKASHLVIEESVELPGGWTCISNADKTELKIYSESGQLIASYGAPFAYEVNEQVSEGADANVTGYYDYKLTGEKLQIFTYISMEWLTQANRNFPLIIDPTINIYPDNTSMWSGYVTSQNNKYSGDLIDISTSATYYAPRGWVKFSLASLSTATSINSASFNIYCYAYSAVSAGTNYLDRLTTEPVSAGGAALYADCGDGPVAWQGTWPSQSVWYNWPLNSSENSHILSSISSNGWVSYAVRRGSSNRYSFYGYPNATYKPYLAVDYTASIPPDDPGNPTSNSPQCGTVTLTRPASPPAGETWYWQGSSCGTSTALGSGANYAATSSGTYYLRARRDSDGVWSASCGSVSVTVIPLPADPANVQASPPVICGVQDLTLSANAGASTLYWFDGSCDNNIGNAIASGNSVLISPGPSTNTTYYVRSYDGSCWSSNCGSVTVIAESIPANPANVTASPASINCGQTSSLSATTTTGNVLWWDAPSGGNLLASRSSGAAYDVMPQSTTTYYAEAATANCTSAARIPVTVTVSSPAAPSSIAATPASIPCNGTSTLTASGAGTAIRWYDAPSAGNLLATTTNGGGFNVSPQSTTDYYAETVNVIGSSPFITEICHNKAATGAPLAGWPAHHLADDYIEITGSPGFDLGGYTLEQWDASTLLSTHTFPSGTLLSPSGTAVIAVGTLGSSVESPANFYYHATGGYSGTFGSTGVAGRILKNSGGSIVDAVGYSGNTTYTFPAAANVSASDWSGQTPNGGSTCGIRLVGQDLNNQNNWVVSDNASYRQDPNTLNSGVIISSSFTCLSDTRTPVTVTVTGLPSPTVSASPSYLCPGSSSNLSATGTGNYILWYDAPSAGNLLGSSANGQNFVVNAPDTTTYYAEAAVLNPAPPFITEVCHYKTTTGAPLAGWPAYLLADDYIEITGAAGFNLAGYILEQWDASAMLSTYTFPAGTVLSPSGTAIFAVGQMGSSVETPASFYYHANGGYSSNFSSGGAAGRILKNPSGVIIDAVGYSGSTGYTFPAGAGVSSAQWSGQTPNGTSTCGIRLTGTDLNNQNNWTLSDNASFRQDPHTLNQGVSLPVNTPTCYSDVRTAVTIYVAYPSIPANATANPDTIICEASSNLSATEIAASDIRWYDAPSGGNLLGTSASGANFSVTPYASTTYYAESYSTCPSTSRTAVSVTVNPIANTANVTASPASINCGQTSSLSATTTTGNVLWWDAPSGGNLLASRSSGAAYDVMPQSTTTYYAEAATANCTSAARIPVTVTVSSPAAPSSIAATPASIPCNGTSTLTASGAGTAIRWYDAPSAGNLLATTTNGGGFNVSPQSTTDYYAETVNVIGSSPFITEICHNKAATGTPLAGWPAHHLTDDYIEITGSPGFDLGGYTLEQWDASALLSTYTFPSGTLLSPSGTAVIAVGQLGTSVESPANYYYHGTGAYTVSSSSTTPIGRILKNSGGSIVDAVVYTGNTTYSFPAAANVSASDWSGQTPNGGSTCGIRLVGQDLNNQNNWVVSDNASYRQDPNTLNSGVIISSSFTCLSDTRTPVTVTVTGLPSPTVSASPSYLCPGSSSNLSATGTGNYILWYDAPSSGNLLGSSANGQNFVVNAPDTTTYYAEAAVLNPAPPFITEICQFRTATTGTPSAGWPAYLLANDYIEITGAPGLNLAGYILEQWDASTMLSTSTFPAGTVLSPSGTAIIAVGELGSSVPSPADYYYHDGYTGTFSSSTPSGRILKNPSGVIIDAVGYSGSTGYTFPAGAGVSSAQWSGQTPNGTSTCGIRLTGTDLNNQNNWTLSDNASFRQDPHTLNQGVSLPVNTPTCYSDVRTAVTIYVAYPSIPANATANPDTIICEASSNLSATEIAASDIRWYDAPSGGNLLGTSASGANFSVTPYASTTYYAESYSTCPSTSRTAVSVTVNPIANTANVTASPASINCGQTSSLSATTTTGNVLWWDAPSGGNLLASRSSGTAYDVMPQSTTTYYAEAATANCTSAARIPVTVSVAPIPDPSNVNASPAAITCGQTSSLSANTATGNVLWWDAPSGGNLLASRSSGAAYDVMPQSTTTYYAEAATIYCTSTSRIPVTVTVSSPAAPSSIAATPASIPCNGTSTLTASGAGTAIRWYDAPSAGNLLATTTNGGGFNVSPQSTTDYYAETVNVIGSSPFITEICHWRASTVGVPLAGFPAYLLADDYIEITGSPGFDLGGYTLEQWDASTLLSTHTFPSGTLLSPSGTAVIAVGTLGSSVESPANFYYHATGGYSGTFGSTGVAGRILKNSGGSIVDAVGYSGNTTYTFPAAANVSASDWSGQTPNGGSTCGIRLVGQDLNNQNNWVVSDNASYRQDPNTLNGGVIISSSFTCVSDTRTPVTVTVTGLPSPTVSASPSYLCPGSSSNLSATGTGNYILWYDAPSAGNLLGSSANGQNFVVNAPDTTTYYAEAAVLNPAPPFITEVCHYKTTTGAPLAGWPAYLLADDYIEITGAAGFNLAGYILEQWDASAMLSTYTFPAGTVLSPSGTAIFAVGQMGSSVETPASFYYHANGGYSSNFSSGGAAGRILKNPSGVIIDAVGYSGSTGYSFPAGAGVSSAQWSGQTPNGTSTCGIRLTGADLNNQNNWTLSDNASFRQDPHTLNQGVSLPVNTPTCYSDVRTAVTIYVAYPSIPANATANPDTIICEASSNLSATEIAASDIRWYDAPSGGNLLGTSASGANFSVTPYASTTYYAESYSTCPSTSRTAVSVTVNPIANTANVTASPASINCGQTSSLSATTTTGNVLWWDAPSGGNLLASRSSGAAYDVMPQSTTTYYAEAATANCTSAARIPVTVTVSSPAAPSSIAATPASIPCNGTSTLTASGAGTAIRWYDAPSAGNLLATTTNGGGFNVSPQSTTDYYAETVNVIGSSPFITEICHNKAATGTPLAGWPAHHLTDDYIEITGSPGFDLGGYTLEQWDASALLSTYTFPSGTLLSPSGTAVIAVGQLGTSVESPANYYYHGTGAYTVSSSSTTPIGRILKNSGGSIVDAVVYTGNTTYSFPAAANVSASDWSGQTPNGGSTCGIRLVGQDLNNQNNWVVSDNASYRQDPNTLNSGVIISSSFTCLSDTRTPVTVTVTGLPSPTVSASPSYLCPGSSSNLSATGTGNYILWYDAPSSGNLLGSSANGQNFVVNAPDTTTYYAEAAVLNPAPPFITEICQFRTATTGTPSAGWPAYLLANDYIEITGAPGLNLAGYILEQWDASTMLSTSTFPAGTVLSPSGTAIIAVGELGSSVPSPADYYYHDGYTGTFSSSTPSGRILKNPSGVIIDAVGYSGSTGYTFPAGAGVSSAQWSGQTPNGTSTCGIRLTGTDLNNQNNWTLSDNASFRQDPHTLNQGVSLPVNTPTCYSDVRTAVTIYVAYPSIPANATANPDTIICEASSNLSATEIAASDIRWYDAPSGGNLLGTSASGANFSVTPYASTTYYAESYSTCPSTSRTAVSVTVNPIANTANVTASPASINCGQTSSLSATTTTGNVLWWDAPSGGICWQAEAAAPPMT